MAPIPWAKMGRNTADEHVDNNEVHDPHMHIASKVTILIGVVLFFASAIGMVVGFGSAIDAGDNKSYVEEQTNGTFTIDGNESWEINVYVIHPVDCDSIQLTIVDSNGRDVLGGCTLWTEMNASAGDEEFYASIDHMTAGMEYTFDSNVKVNVRGTYCDEACTEAVLGGIAASGLGFIGACCAVPLTILGIILAFVLDDPKTNAVMPVGQMTVGQSVYAAPIGSQAPVAQAGYQTPVGQAYQPAAVPITPITPPMNQQQTQPAQPAQSPWDNVLPPK